MQNIYVAYPEYPGGMAFKVNLTSKYIVRFVRGS